MCPSMRYPEAFPLRNISAVCICKNLIHMFTTFGIPQEVKSDRGSNLTSELFSKVPQELGINQTFSTAYHPELQGALERWHHTLNPCSESSVWRIRNAGIKVCHALGF